MSPADARIKVVLVDDEVGFGEALMLGMAREGIALAVYTDPVRGLEAACEPGVDVALLDLNLPGTTGLDLLKQLKARRSEAEVVMVSGQGSIQSAVDAVRAGAYDYLTKPFERFDEVVTVVRHASERKRLLSRNRELERLVTTAPGEDFVGQSSKMKDVFRLIEQVSYSASSVLIQGESGTGKELVARAIHRKSPRAARPFVAINCAALTETLLESELFGHARGAFTGAAAAKRGLFEAADGGALFLDEVGDMAPSTQVRLLRALQEGEVRPVGSTETVKVDVRVIAATNVDLQKAISSGRFREDLYYRINVINIRLPALRERPTDVPLLAYHFLRIYSKKLGKEIERIHPDAMEALATNSWPGNVREMENVVERAVVLARGNEVTLENLPPDFLRRRGGAFEEPDAAEVLPYSQAKRLAVGAFDRRYLTRLLQRTDGNVTAAAALAGLDRSNFRRLLKQYGIAGDQGAEGVERDPTRPNQ